MANYTDNVLKIFVPEELEILVEGVIKAVASKCPVDDEKYSWLDFDRLLPEPEEFREDDPYADEISCLMRKAWPREIGPQPHGKSIEEAYRELGPERASSLDKALEAKEKYGVYRGYEWRLACWGTKWLPEGGEPQISLYEGCGEYDVPEGTVIITWRFSTANSAPVGYVAALSRACQSLGLGLRYWQSYDDGGQQWNPVEDQYETLWTEEHDVQAEMGLIPYTQAMIFLENCEFPIDEAVKSNVKDHEMVKLFTLMDNALTKNEAEKNGI